MSLINEHLEETLSSGFTTLPHWIERSTDLRLCDKIAYLALLEFGHQKKNEDFKYLTPTLEKLCFRSFTTNRTTLSRGLNRLAELGLISIKRTGRANQYVFLDHWSYSEVAEKAKAFKKINAKKNRNKSNKKQILNENDASMNSSIIQNSSKIMNSLEENQNSLEENHIIYCFNNLKKVNNFKKANTPKDLRSLLAYNKSIYIAVDSNNKGDSIANRDINNISNIKDINNNIVLNKDIDSRYNNNHSITYGDKYASQDIQRGHSIRRTVGESNPQSPLPYRGIDNGNSMSIDGKQIAICVDKAASVDFSFHVSSDASGIKIVIGSRNTLHSNKNAVPLIENIELTQSYASEEKTQNIESSCELEAMHNESSNDDDFFNITALESDCVNIDSTCVEEICKDKFENVKKHEKNTNEGVQSVGKECLMNPVPKPKKEKRFKKEIKEKAEKIYQKKIENLEKKLEKNKEKLEQQKEIDKLVKGKKVEIKRKTSKKSTSDVKRNTYAENAEKWKLEANGKYKNEEIETVFQAFALACKEYGYTSEVSMDNQDRKLIAAFFDKWGNDVDLTIKFLQTYVKRYDFFRERDTYRDQMGATPIFNQVMCTWRASQNFVFIKSGEAQKKFEMGNRISQGKLRPEVKEVKRSLLDIIKKKE